MVKSSKSRPGATPKDTAAAERPARAKAGVRKGSAAEEAGKAARPAPKTIVARMRQAKAARAEESVALGLAVSAVKAQQARDGETAETPGRSLPAPRQALAGLVRKVKKLPARGIRLYDLRENHCRWVIEEPGRESVFCGAPKAGGSSWCAEHRRIVYPRAAAEAPAEPGTPGAPVRQR